MADLPTRPPLALIAAVSRNNVLGRDNAIPWHYPADMRFFRRMTVGHALIMGRKTFDSLGKPLPGRTHFVLTRDTSWQSSGCQTAHVLGDALGQARQIDPCPMIIGGAQIYALALPEVTIMYLTHIDEDVEGDVWFPEVTWEDWQAKELFRQDKMRFVSYIRRKP